LGFACTALVEEDYAVDVGVEVGCITFLGVSSRTTVKIND
jgi:hypothetical protein